MTLKNRCAWVSDEPIYIRYHDEEWGVPLFDDRLLFEFLNLEGAQAGLSWITILKKRENYRKLFDNFDPLKIAKYNAKTIERLLQNSGIVRNRLKIASVISNAKSYLSLLEEGRSFSEYLWDFVGGRPIQNDIDSFNKTPTKNLISDKMSKDLKKRGFKFVGTTICYAFMQAVGMVNDHAKECFRYKEIQLLVKG